MSFKRLITSFVFTEGNRNEIFLSDTTKIRLNAEDLTAPVLQLKISGTTYPTDSDLYAISEAKTPQAIKQWLGIEILGDFPANTAVKIRLKNESREIFWNGTTWATAGVSDWNTEEEIRANLTTFPFDDNTVQIVLNLSTTDVNATPKVSEVKLLGMFDLDEYQDAIETLIQRLRDQIRPITDVSTSVLTTTDTFDFASEDYPLFEKGYNILNVIAVYDLTVDPLVKNNLVSSYIPGLQRRDGTFEPGIVTTTSQIQAGNDILFKVEYVPEVADHTDEDYYEIGKLPTINIERISEFNRRDGAAASQVGSEVDSPGDYVRDIPNLTAVQIQPPAQIDLRVEYAIFTNLSMDQKRIAAEVEKFVQNNRLLFSLGRDEPFSLEIVSRLKTENKGNLGNLMKSTGTFDLRNVSLFLKPSLDVPLISGVNVDFTT